MAIKGMLWGLTAESAIHAGVGQLPAAVDLPVARERATGFPYIAASSLKGSLRAAAKEDWENDEARLQQVFGKMDSAGALSIGDARLALLPVRSLQSSFFWVTCPYVLERLQRDAAVAGVTLPALGEVPEISRGTALGANTQTVYLEELSFAVEDHPKAKKAAEIFNALWAHESLKKRCHEQLLILNDEEFAYFARYALAVQAHNVLAEGTKKSENLWYAETLPPDSLLYTTVLVRRSQAAALTNTAQWLRERGYVQLGGGETTGLGWCATAVCEGGEG